MKFVRNNKGKETTIPSSEEVKGRSDKKESQVGSCSYRRELLYRALLIYLSVEQR